MGVQAVSPKGEVLMKADGQALDALCNSSKVTYYTLVDGLGTTKPDRKLKYQVAAFSEIKIGTWGDVSGFLARQKQAREKGGSSMDLGVLRPSNSGVPNAFMSVRFVEKMEELDGSENTGEMYDKIFGDDSFYKDWNNYLSVIKSTHYEIRALRTDLSNL